MWGDRGMWHAEEKFLHCYGCIPWWRSFGRFASKSEDNNETKLRKMGKEGLDSIRLAEDRNHCRAVVNTGMKLGVSLNAGNNLLNGWGPVSFSRSIYLPLSSVQQLFWRLLHLFTTEFSTAVILKAVTFIYHWVQYSSYFEGCYIYSYMLWYFFPPPRGTKAVTIMDWCTLMELSFKCPLLSCASLWSSNLLHVQIFCCKTNRTTVSEWRAAVT